MGMTKILGNMWQRILLLYFFNLVSAQRKCGSHRFEPTPQHRDGTLSNCMGSDNFFEEDPIYSSYNSDDNSTCWGSSSTAMRVTQGVKAEPNSWPMLVRLKFSRTKTERVGTREKTVQQIGLTCGATIVHEYFLLTAAHCCQNITQMIAYFGDYDIRKNDSKIGEFQMSIDPKFIFPHQNYTDSKNNNDICLIRTPYHIMKTGELTTNCNNCTAIACIATTEVITGNNCWIAGWGTKRAGGSHGAKRIIEGGLSVMGPKFCKNHSVPRIRNSLQLDEICAANVTKCKITGGVDACQGDSGGPLICPDRQDVGTGILTGITAWGVDCGEAKKPGIYSNVFYFYQNQWLQNTFDKLNSMKEFDDCDPGVIPESVNITGNDLRNFLNGEYKLEKLENQKPVYKRVIQKGTRNHEFFITRQDNAWVVRLGKSKIYMQSNESKLCNLRSIQWNNVKGRGPNKKLLDFTGEFSCE